MAARAIWWLLAALAVSTEHVLSDSVSDRCYNQKADEPEVYTDITILYLHDSNITILTAENIKCYPNLQHLDLNGNIIRSIDPETFNSSTALQNLFLEGNAFSGATLSPFLFSHAYQLRVINFSGNNMSGTSPSLLRPLRRLRSLYMNSCSLLEFPPVFTYNTYSNMRWLQLKNNKISRIDNPDTFIHLENLEAINLSNNKIHYLHEDLLRPLRAIVFIVLAGNKISYIPEGFFYNKSSISHIDLSYNFIENVAVDAFFGTRLQVLDLSGNRLTYLSDQFCSKLRSSGVRLEHLYFTGNPWQCSCLNDVLVEAKKLNIRYVYMNDRDIRFKYDGKHPVCVMTDNFKCHRIEVYQNLFYNVINGR